MWWAFSTEQEPRAFPKRISGTAGDARLGITSGQDSTESSSGGSPFATGKARGEGKPETFTFLGLPTTVGNATRAEPSLYVGSLRKKRMVAKLKAIKAELQRRMHDRMANVGAWLRKVVLGGYYQYHAVPGNTTQLRIL